MRRAAAVVALLSTGLALVAPTPVAAHPFGPFSISVSSGLVISEDHIDIRWVMDMAQTAATATVDLIDSDGNGRITDAEKADYFDLWVGSIVTGISLVVDGQEVEKSVVNRELTLRTDEGGSPAIRLVMDLTVPIGGGGGTHVAAYRDTNYTDYPGWREVAVATGPGIELLASTAPTTGRTKELTEYPADLGLSVPTSEAEFTFAAAARNGPTQAVPVGRSVAQEPASGFSFWPTGVLAAATVLGLIVLLVVLNRPADAGGKGPRVPPRR